MYPRLDDENGAKYCWIPIGVEEQIDKRHLRVPHILDFRTERQAVVVADHRSSGEVKRSFECAEKTSAMRILRNDTICGDTLMLLSRTTLQAG